MIDPQTRLATALADRYRIERPLGQGGMATVYLAEDIKHDRKVAIKVLKPELAAVLGAERFVQEIKTTAALSHPHILPLFDSGEADGFLYYVMPYIAGETIRDRLNRETQLGVDEAVRITCEIADALDYAHRHGVIHRDIKPENLLLHDGRAMVMDFGIALAVSAAAGGRMTETGLSLGTPHYMSPEQATAEREITARSDIYSLGSVLYEMLSGEPPHIGNSAQAIIMKIVTEDAAPVTRLRKAVPTNVAAAVAKSLERLAADRFDSAKAFGDALKDANFATKAMPAVGAATTPSRWRGALIGGVALGAIVGAVAMLLRPAPSARGELNRDQLTFSGIASRPAISPDGRRIAYVVDACTPAEKDCTVSLEVLEVGGTKAQVLIPAALGLGYPRWSHDGETIVIGATLERGRSGIFAIPRLNATPRLIYEGARAYDTHPAADSVLVLSQSHDSLRVVSMADGAVSVGVAVALNGVTDLAWSPNGARVAINDATGLHVLDRKGAELGLYKTSESRSWVRWNTEGDAILYFRTGRAREDELVRLDVSADGAVAAQDVVIMPRTPTLYNGEFDVARKTGAVVIATGDATTDLWSFDLDQRPLVGAQETRGTTWYGTPAVSSDAQFLYYLRGDALGDNVYRLDRNSREEVALTAENGPGANRVTMSSDGTRLAYARSINGRMMLQAMDVTSRRVTGAPVATGDVLVPVPPRGFLAMSERGALTHIDSMGAVPRILTDSDSLVVLSSAITPDGVTAVFVGVQLGAAGASASVFVGRVSTQGGAITRLSTLAEPVGRPGAVSVTMDGTLFIAQWVPGNARPSLFRMPLSGGSLVRAADLPAACAPLSLVVDWSGKTATCVVDQYRGDIWLVNLGRATR